MRGDDLVERRGLGLPRPVDLGARRAGAGRCGHDRYNPAGKLEPTRSTSWGVRAIVITWPGAGSKGGYLAQLGGPTKDTRGLVPGDPAAKKKGQELMVHRRCATVSPVGRTPLQVGRFTGVPRPFANMLCPSAFAAASSGPAARA